MPNNKSVTWLLVWERVSDWDRDTELSCVGCVVQTGRRHYLWQPRCGPWSQCRDTMAAQSRGTSCDASHDCPWHQATGKELSASHVELLVELQCAVTVHHLISTVLYDCHFHLLFWSHNTVKPLISRFDLLHYFGALIFFVFACCAK